MWVVVDVQGNDCVFLFKLCTFLAHDSSGLLSCDIIVGGAKMLVLRGTMKLFQPEACGLCTTRLHWTILSCDSWASWQLKEAAELVESYEWIPAGFCSVTSPTLLLITCMLSCLGSLLCRALTHKGLPHLVHLDVSGLYLATASALSEVATKCPRLKAEQLSYCDNIMDGPYSESANGCGNLDSGLPCCRNSSPLY